VNRMQTVLLVSSVVVEESSDFAVAFDYDSGRTFILNRPASTVIRVLHNPKSIEDIVDLLSSMFPDAGRDVIESGIVRFLNSLEGYGLLREAGDV
jgi:hypothetical protein